MRVIKVLAIAAILLGNATGTVVAKDKRAAQAPVVAVGPQYDSTHVYVAPADLESFTFGGDLRWHKVSACNIYSDAHVQRDNF